MIKIQILNGTERRQKFVIGSLYLFVLIVHILTIKMLQKSQIRGEIKVSPLTVPLRGDLIGHFSQCSKMIFVWN